MQKFSISEEQFNDWKEQYITKEVMRYMHDYADRVRNELLSALSVDPADFVKDDIVRLQAQAYGMTSVLEDTIELEYKDIEQFYNHNQED